MSLPFDNYGGPSPTRRTVQLHPLSFLTATAQRQHRPTHQNQQPARRFWRIREVSKGNSVCLSSRDVPRIKGYIARRNEIAIAPLVTLLRHLSSGIVDQLNVKQIFRTLIGCNICFLNLFRRRFNNTRRQRFLSASAIIRPQYRTLIFSSVVNLPIKRTS